MRRFIVFIVLLISVEVSAQSTHGYRAGIGIPVRKNLIVGLQDNFRYKSQGQDKLFKYSNTAGPFIRYNVPFGRFAVFPQVTAGIGIASNTTYVLDWGTGRTLAKRSNQFATEYLAGIGATFFITPKIGVESLLDFDVQKKRPSLDFGLQFYLRSTTKQKI